MVFKMQMTEQQLQAAAVLMGSNPMLLRCSSKGS
jgi:hypothetical protein